MRGFFFWGGGVHSLFVTPFSRLDSRCMFAKNMEAKPTKNPEEGVISIA